MRTHRSPLIDANIPTGLLPSTDTNLPSGAAIFDPDRTCLGAEQKQWFTDRLVASTATWKHIGTGYPFLALRLEDYDTPAVRKDPPEGWHPTVASTPPPSSGTATGPSGNHGPHRQRARSRT